MTGLFGSAIIAFCMGAATGSYNDACIHAMDAGTKQSGISQQMDSVEDKSVEIVNRHVIKTFGKETMSVIAAGGYIYRVAREGRVSFRIPTLGICSSLNNEITADSYKLLLEWKL